MRAHALCFGAEPMSDHGVEVDLIGDLKTVEAATDPFTALAVILLRARATARSTCPASTHSPPAVSRGVP